MISVNQSVREGALQTYFYSDEVSVGTAAPVKEVSFVRTGAIGTVRQARISSEYGTLVCAQASMSPRWSGAKGIAVSADARALYELGSLAGSYALMQSLALLVSSGVVHATAPSDLDSAEVEAQLHLNKMCAFERLYSRRRALDYMYDFLEDAFFEKKISMVDDALVHACSGLIGGSLAVSFLRATSRAKAKLRFWNYYYAHVKNSLKDDPDSARILRGL